MDASVVTPMITETSTNDEVYNFIQLQHTSNEASQPSEMESTVQTETMEHDSQVIEPRKEIGTTAVDQTNQFDQNITHMTQTFEPVNLYVCDKCNRTFKQKSRYERHIQNHPSEKHYLCETCHKTFTRVSHLEKHIKTHTEERSHLCEVCGAAFILPHHLVRHMLVHSGERPYQCEVCNKTFTRKAGLTQHQHVHTGLRPYGCEHENCGRYFTDKTTLRRHMMTHSSEKPFVCKECDKTFRTKSACRKHYLRHFKDGASYKCGVCEEMFKDEREYKMHLETHDEKQRTGAHRCGFCLRVFKSQEDLNAHVPLHESGLQYTCERCSARFFTQVDFLKHTAKHFEESTLAVEQNIQEQHHVSTATNAQPKENEVPQQKDALPNPQNTLQEGNENVNKLLVVLQLPQSASNLRNEQGALQVDSIQQLLGTVRIDKLVVTTDPISNSSQAVALQLSQSQQQSIQQILQTTHIRRQNPPISTLESLNKAPLNALETLTSTLNEAATFPDLTSHDTMDAPDLSQHVQSSFVLKSLSHQPPPPPESKSVSQYLIVPPTGPGFTPIVNSKIKIIHKPPEPIGNNSVFTRPPPNLLQNNELVPTHPLELIVNDEDVPETGVKQGDSFEPNTTSLTMGSLHQTPENSNTEEKVRNSSSSNYFQHSSEYENPLENDILQEVPM
ncbi:uncharacterized protein [Clytia hemisphaerica]|uniref:C2H2-type domain-containing protein n=1 Tax=Clytia hemisphaerica TaxID=252671 RepID=A0A7M5USY1_9CNID